MKRHWSQSAALPRPNTRSAPVQETDTMNDHRKDRIEPVSDGALMTGAPNNPSHIFLTTGEAAHFLRLSARTLERFRVEGTGPRFTKAGPGVRARVLYRRSDLEDWLNSFRYDSTSQYGQDR